MKSLIALKIITNSNCIQSVFDLSMQMLKVWSENSLHPWKKTFIKTFKMLIKIDESTQFKSQGVNFVISLSEKN